jgi:inorganic triphosphatase YgiF
LKVYDILGREVATLAQGVHQRGEYSVTFSSSTNDVHELPSGMYLYRLQTPSGVETRQMVLLK